MLERFYRMVSSMRATRSTTETPSFDTKMRCRELRLELNNPHIRRLKFRQSTDNLADNLRSVCVGGKVRQRCLFRRSFNHVFEVKTSTGR
jgi:hypothetical protein